MTSALLWDDFGVTLGCRYRQAAAVSPLLTVAAAALPPPPERTFDERLEQFCPKGALFAEAPQARQELFPRLPYSSCSKCHKPCSICVAPGSRNEFMQSAIWPILCDSQEVGVHVRNEV